MSSNNQVLIIEKKDKFNIHENMCVDNDFKPNKNNLINSFDDLREAVNWANNYCMENMVEYGTYIILNKSKKKGQIKSKSTN